ncbi:hypothetical protein CRG98_023464 [Punica granatum]|uniref:Uncharacterized protein n=1 Tax=Punica granatum TaxID=22663 RepID=A0A2I0JKS2_PUNGR|nr:hypothetical protein CRG98_023464 [Punica granatum]
MNSNPGFDQGFSCRKPLEDVAKDHNKHPLFGPGDSSDTVPPHGCSYLAWTCRDIALDIKTGTDPKETGIDPKENRINLKETEVCAPEFNLVGARMRAPKQTRLGSVHLPGDARRTHVRRSRYLPFYDPKVEGRQVTRV